MIPKSLGVQISKVKADCYSADWLKKPDETEYVVEPFPTNGDRSYFINYNVYQEVCKANANSGRQSRICRW